MLSCSSCYKTFYFVNYWARKLECLPLLVMEVGAYPGAPGHSQKHMARLSITNTLAYLELGTGLTHKH